MRSAFESEFLFAVWSAHTVEPEKLEIAQEAAIAVENMKTARAFAEQHSALRHLDYIAATVGS